MADNAGTIQFRPAQKADSPKPKEDRQDRYEVVIGATNALCGELFINKGVAVAASDTFTLTVVAPT